MSTDPWMQTASGRTWDLLTPSAEDVHWPDIAESLAKLCRFNGHTTHFYSVAQHCCLVADSLPPEWRLHGLLHDAHEAFVGDQTSPLKESFKALDGIAALERLTEITDRAIYAAAGMETPLDPTAVANVKFADLTLLATERRDLLAPTDRLWSYALPTPLPTPIKPWSWPRAAEEWIERLRAHLLREGRLSGERRAI